MLNVMREQTGPVQQQTSSLPYDVVALVLQGGGALGAYQAGVYEGLHEQGVRMKVAPRRVSVPPIGLRRLHAHS